MTDIYAVCLSMSQGSEGVSMRAHLLYSEEGRTTESSIEWPKLDDINANGNAAEWLYSALSRLMMNYDDHTVYSAEIRGESIARMVNQREA